MKRTSFVCAIGAGCVAAGPLNESGTSSASELGGMLLHLPEIQQDLRCRTAAQLAELSGLIERQDWPAARRLAGGLGMAQTVADERKTLMNAVMSIPEVERPVVNETLIDEPWTADFLAAYGVNVSAMTKSELTDFAVQVVTGVREASDRADPSDTYAIMRAAAIGEVATEKVLNEAVRTLAPKVGGMTDPSYIAEYVLNATIAELGKLTSTSAALFLVQQLESEISAGHFRSANHAAVTTRSHSIVLELADAIEAHARRNPNNPQLFTQMQKLKDFTSRLEAEGNEINALHSLRETVRLLQQANGRNSIAFHALTLPKG